MDAKPMHQPRAANIAGQRHRTHQLGADKINILGQQPCWDGSGNALAHMGQRQLTHNTGCNL
jgi:hypothetical protein